MQFSPNLSPIQSDEEPRKKTKNLGAFFGTPKFDISKKLQNPIDQQVTRKNLKKLLGIGAPLLQRRTSRDSQLSRASSTTNSQPQTRSVSQVDFDDLLSNPSESTDLQSQQSEKASESRLSIQSKTDQSSIFTTRKHFYPSIDVQDILKEEQPGPKFKKNIASYLGSRRAPGPEDKKKNLLEFFGSPKTSQSSLSIPDSDHSMDKKYFKRATLKIKNLVKKAKSKIERKKTALEPQFVLHSVTERLRMEEQQLAENFVIQVQVQQEPKIKAFDLDPIDLSQQKILPSLWDKRQSNLRVVDLLHSQDKLWHDLLQDEPRPSETTLVPESTRPSEIKQEDVKMCERPGINVDAILEDIYGNEEFKRRVLGYLVNQDKHPHLFGIGEEGDLLKQLDEHEMVTDEIGSLLSFDEITTHRYTDDLDSFRSRVSTGEALHPLEDFEVFEEELQGQSQLEAVNEVIDRYLPKAKARPVPDDDPVLQLAAVNAAAEAYVQSIKSQTPKKSTLKKIERYLKSYGVPGPDTTPDEIWDEVAQVTHSQQQFRQLVGFMFGQPQSERRSFEKHQMVSYEEIWKSDSQ